MPNDKKDFLKKSLASVAMKSTGRKMSYGLEVATSAKKKKNEMYYPTLYIDTDQAPSLDDCELGEKETFVVEGVIRSKTSSETSDGRDHYSYSIEVHKIGKL